MLHLHWSKDNSNVVHLLFGKDFVLFVEAPLIHRWSQPLHLFLCIFHYSDMIICATFRLKLQFLFSTIKTYRGFLFSLSSSIQLVPAVSSRPYQTKTDQKITETVEHVKMWKCDLGLVCWSPLVPTGQWWNHINKKPLIYLLTFTNTTINIWKKSIDI